MMSVVFKKFLSQALSNSAPAADLRSLVLETNPTGSRATSLRLIARDLLSATQAYKSVAVIPAQSGNITGLIANLAYALAEMQVTVCLVEADLRRTRLAALFGLSTALPGLTDVLDRDSSLDGVEYKINSCLTIVPGGQVRGDVIKSIAAPKLNTLMHELASRYSLTLTICPAAPDFLDYSFIARACESTLLIAQKDKCRLADVESLRDRLAKIDIPLAYVLLAKS